MENERDKALEEAAQAIEHPDFAELRGVLSKTKKGQREYEIRVAAIRETKLSMARYIRSFKSGKGNDIRTSLARIAEEPIERHQMYARDAWQMAELGWVDIFVTLQANTNSIPPDASYRIELTDKGRRVLDGYKAA